MKAPNPHELKGLESQLARAQADKSVCQAESKIAAEKEFAAHNRVLEIKKKITTIKNMTADPIISEHAILRWIERVRGVNLEQIKAEMLDERTKDSIRFARSGKLTRDGVTIVFQNNTIVTVEV